MTRPEKSKRKRTPHRPYHLRHLVGLVAIVLFYALLLVGLSFLASS